MSDYQEEQVAKLARRVGWLEQGIRNTLPLIAKRLGDQHPIVEDLRCTMIGSSAADTPICALLNDADGVAWCCALPYGHDGKCSPKSRGGGLRRVWTAS